MSNRVTEIAEFKTDAVGKAVVHALFTSNQKWMSREDIATNARSHLNQYYSALSGVMKDRELYETAQRVLATLEERWYVGREGNFYTCLM